MLNHTRSIVLDISTSALPNAADFIDVADIKAPKNYVDPAKIDAYKAEAVAEKLAAAALDWDLARVTGVVTWVDGEVDPVISTCKDDHNERITLAGLAVMFAGDYRLISYNGLSFDWPMLMRRARYLGVPFPVINCDRYRSPHVDLLALLSANDPSRRKSLGWYAKRLNMGLVKPLSGAEEAQVPQTGKWDELRASLEHDVTAIHKLAQWLGVL